LFSPLKQIVSILFFRTNLPCIPLIEIQRRVRSRFVHDFGTCKKNAAAQWRILTNLATKTRLKIPSRHCAAAFSFEVPKSCADLDPTILYISISGTYSKFVQKNKMTALGLPPTAMPEGWPQVATNNLFRFHNNEFDEMPCKLDSTEYARSFRTKPNPKVAARPKQ